MSASTPEVIKRYFDVQSGRDFDSMLTLFSDDAEVIDEGKTWTGAGGIRSWRENAASVYEYTTEVVDIRPVDKGQFAAQVHLEGNFPGGTVDLEYRFTLEGQQIQRLEID